jgi:hypothetical protein
MEPSLASRALPAEAASLRWPNRRRLDDVPSEVLALSAWPLWRRLLLRPPEEAKTRIKAWRDLACRDRLHIGPPPPFPFIRPKGIFGESRTYWERLVGYDGRGTKFEGLTFSYNRVRRSTIGNPHGPLVLTTTADRFECDITDIEGISASKSSDLHFDSVDAFGRYFNELKRAPITPEGLAVMLKHGEVRVTHSPGADAFSVAMWDGRLFLDNHGGSHHFAGAAYIARAIGQPLPIAARLKVHCLNVPSWTRLIERSHLLHVPSRPRHWSIADTARLVGETYKMELPGSLGGGDILMLPRAAPSIRLVIDALANKGVPEVTPYFEDLLISQAEIQRRWSERLSLSLVAA